MARPITLPTWVTTGAGVAALVLLALATADVIPTPRWPGAARRNASGSSVETHAAEAEATARRAAVIIRDAKLAAGLPVERGQDDASGALVGSEITPLVTTLGSLEAKRLAASPAWARVLTVELARAGIHEGSVVAGSFSGSFPGLNLAVVSAAQALGAKLVAVTSVTASTWGATDPGFTWPELEVRLVRAGVFAVPAAAAISVGGAGDRGTDLEPEARDLAHRIATECARALGATVFEPHSFEDAVRLRIAVFDERRGRAPLAAYVNVGGVEASLGRSPAILKMRNGWLGEFPPSREADMGVIARMSARGVPVLHLLNVRELGERWGVH